MKLNLSIFFFVSCAFGIISKQPLSHPGSSTLTPIFSSKSVIRSMIHFELSFVLLRVDLHLSLVPFVEKTIFPT